MANLETKYTLAKNKQHKTAQKRKKRLTPAKEGNKKISFFLN